MTLVVDLAALGLQLDLMNGKIFSSLNPSMILMQLACSHQAAAQVRSRCTASLQLVLFCLHLLLPAAFPLEKTPEAPVKVCFIFTTPRRGCEPRSAQSMSSNGVLMGLSS